MLTTLLIVTNIITLVFLFFIANASLRLSGRLLSLEDLRNDEEDFLERSKKVLIKVHAEIDKVSKYPVVSNEPIVVLLVKVVKEARDEVASLLDDFAAEEEPDDRPNTNAFHGTNEGT